MPYFPSSACTRKGVKAFFIVLIMVTLLKIKNKILFYKDGIEFYDVDIYNYNIDLLKEKSWFIPIEKSFINLIKFHNV